MNKHNNHSVGLKSLVALLLLTGIGGGIAPAAAQGNGQGQEQDEEPVTPEGQEGQWQAPNQGPPMGNDPDEVPPNDAAPQPPAGNQQPPQPQPPATGGQTGIDRTGILNAHNELRARHGVPAMQWSDALQQESQTWANRCVFEHSTTRNGENLSWWTGNNTQASRVHDWYSEIKDYSFATGESTNGNAVGHFTQIVWRASNRVGCGIANCNGGKTLVCQYSPAGNVQGLYLTNVPPAR